MKKILSILVAVVSMVQLSAQGFNWSSPPTAISTAAVDASDPDVVIDASGNTTAIWIESSTVRTSTLPSGGSWSAPSSLSGTGGTNPCIGIDSAGNVTAAWLEGGNVKTANMPSGGSWGSASNISDTGATDPALYVDGAGNAVAVWVRNGYIETATQQVGNSWGSVSMLSAASSDNPAIAIGEEGTIVAIWHTVVTGQDRVYASVGGIGQAWNTPLVVAPLTAIGAAYSFNYPSVAVDDNGNAAAVYFLYVNVGDAYTNVYTMGSSLISGASAWSQPSFLSAEGFRNPADLMNTIAFDGNGNALALWTSSSDGQSFNIESAQFTAAGTWTPSSALVLQSLYAYQGDISVNPSGDASSIYMFSDSGNTIIQSSDTSIASNVSGFWSIPINVSLGSQNGFPRIATMLVSGVISGATVWVYNDGSNNRIAASIGTRNVVAPPTDVGIVQDSSDQGVFVEYFNTISWTESTDPNLVAYNIFRNGFYWTQVAAGTTTVIDHNAVQDGSVTYGVAAVNSSQEQSSIVSASFP
ncbi:MAG: hypothetical protein V4492_08520 [Chlamydiota bacterium]